MAFYWQQHGKNWLINRDYLHGQTFKTFLLDWKISVLEVLTLSINFKCLSALLLELRFFIKGTGQSGKIISGNFSQLTFLPLLAWGENTKFCLKVFSSSKEYHDTLFANDFLFLLSFALNFHSKSGKINDIIVMQYIILHVSRFLLPCKLLHTAEE